MIVFFFLFGHLGKWNGRRRGNLGWEMAAKSDRKRIYKEDRGVERRTKGSFVSRARKEIKMKGTLIHFGSFSKKGYPTKTSSSFAKPFFKGENNPFIFLVHTRAIVKERAKEVRNSCFNRGNQTKEGP